MNPLAPLARSPHPAWAVGRAFAGLGLTAFGGPVAHLALFRQRFVHERGWVSEAQLAQWVALCQLLPGPTSSQVGLAIGLHRAGPWGALAAWLGFSLPSAALMVALAWGLGGWAAAVGATGALHGLKLAAAAIVAHALWGMARTLCPDGPRRALALACAALLLLWPAAAAQALALAAAAGVGLLAPRWTSPDRASAGCPAVSPAPPQSASPHSPAGLPSRRGAVAALVALGVLLLALPLAAAAWPSLPLALAEAMVRAGALVWGGGHVVLPLLQAEVVPTGWLSPSAFLAGYGAAQAVPGPLFSIGAYVGASVAPLAHAVAPGSATGLGWAALWGLGALVALFAPGVLALWAALPFWERLSLHPQAQAAIWGLNAGVVGLLAAAWLGMVLPAALVSATDAAAIAALLVLQGRLRWPPWALVAAALAWGLALG